MDNDSGHERTPKKRPLVRVWEPIFLEALEETGNVSLAAKRAEIGRQTAYDRREQAPKFKEAWAEAIDVAVDTLAAEARRRAVEGTEEPIMYLGEVVAKVRKYSDTLLIFLLKAYRPNVYRETINQRISGEDGGPVRLTIEAKDLTDDELARIARKD